MKTEPKKCFCEVNKNKGSTASFCNWNGDIEKPIQRSYSKFMQSVI